jgi:HK97 family phage major capsid protein
MSNIHAFRQRKAEVVKAQRALLDTAAKEERGLSESESAKYEDNIKKLEGIEASIIREEKQLEMERSMSALQDENSRATREASGLENANAGEQPGTPAAKPFASLGEQLIAVARSSMGNFRQDPRLVRAAISGTGETAPADGGFLVHKDFSDLLLQRTYEMGQISQRVFRVPISANSNGVKINAIDEDSRVDGSRWGGVLAYWQNEADTMNATKPKFRQIQIQLQKLTGLCYATDELLQDASALEAVIMQTFPQEFTFKVEDAIINGTGSGQPLGIINSGAVLQVAKDGADSGATVSTPDVLSMWSRCWGRSRQNAVWLVNQDVEPKLYPLTLGSGTAVQLLYTPPGTRDNGGQYGLLLGRPVIPVEYCATLGTPGDIILADFSQYVMSDKGAPQAASSIHVRFLNDETTFRFTYRVDGQPVWKKPLTPKNGSNTYSPFITLATRS